MSRYLKYLSLCFVFGITCLYQQKIHAQTAAYIIKKQATIYSQPSSEKKQLGAVNHNTSVNILKTSGTWSYIEHRGGLAGWTASKNISQTWVKVHKKERKLYLMKGDSVEKTFPIALSRQNPLEDKEKQGDYATPLGRFFIAKRIKHPKAARYGARSLHLSYPSMQATRNGLRKKYINYRQYLNIANALKRVELPPQNTALGSSIRIHGGGNEQDWTWGCIALSDPAIKELYPHLVHGTRVDVYRSKASEEDAISLKRRQESILKAAKTQLLTPALYTRRAMSYQKLSYPYGDINKAESVCTDTVIRSFRKVGVNFQALVHEDILRNPKAYRRWVKKADYHIDHRRAKVMEIYLRRNFINVRKLEKEKRTFQPGDIVFFETGIPNGTQMDHVGIVSQSRRKGEAPLVINIWTVGYRTNEMKLLNQSYPEVTAHYRMPNPIEFQ